MDTDYIWYCHRENPATQIGIREAHLFHSWAAVSSTAKKWNLLAAVKGSVFHPYSVSHWSVEPRGRVWQFLLIIEFPGPGPRQVLIKQWFTDRREQ